MFFQKTGTRLFSPWWFGLYGIEEINNQRLVKAVIPLDQLLHQAKQRLREFALHTTSSIVPVGRPPTCWHPPERPLYKLNFDGALFESEKCAGLGVILRNHEGQVMVSLTERTMLPFTAIEVEGSKQWQLGEL